MKLNGNFLNYNSKVKISSKEFVWSEHTCLNYRIFDTRLKPYFNACALIFYGWKIEPTHSQPTKHAKNYGIHFLTLKATIFDTHDIMYQRQHLY